MRSYLKELGQTLKENNFDEAQAKSIVRDALRTAEFILPDEKKECGWTAEDTKACIVGHAGQKVSPDQNDSRDAILRLIPFGEIFDAMLTERYERSAATLVEDNWRIEAGILGYMAFNDHHFTA